MKKKKQVYFWAAEYKKNGERVSICGLAETSGSARELFYEIGKTAIWRHNITKDDLVLTAFNKI